MTETDVIKATVIESLEIFTRYFFKKKNRKKFVVGEHHRIIFDALERVKNGECRRLIINIAPRYGKTEIAVKNFIGYSLALNPRAKFIHLSYADALALDNSEEIKDMINSEEFQELFPNIEIKKDSKAKNKWYTTEGGGVLARSAGGQVTGFGAGETDDEEFESDLFGGAIIIDDPIKPDDALSDTIRDRVNERFDSTIRSRVNSRKTPIIVIMQRIHEQDLTGYLMENEPEEWEVISLPVIKEDGAALWEYKHTKEELEKLKKANEFVYETQYMQNPKPKVGYLFPKNELKTFKQLPEQIDAKLGYIDVADTGEDDHSLPIGLQSENLIYIDEVLYTKISAELRPELCRYHTETNPNT